MQCSDAEQFFLKKKQMQQENEWTTKKNIPATHDTCRLGIVLMNVSWPRPRPIDDDDVQRPCSRWG
jgi:hypothetical protein